MVHQNVREAEPGFITRPRLEAALPAWQKMMAYVQACPTEINGFGYIERAGNTFFLDEVFILDQVVTMGSADVREEALLQHLCELTSAGEDAGKMRFQWHSHVNMDVYFSKTDRDTIENYAGDWMISLVANKFGEYKVRLDVFKPFRVWTPVDVTIRAAIDPDTASSCQQEIRDKVREEKPLRLSRKQARVKTEDVPMTLPLDTNIVVDGD